MFISKGRYGCGEPKNVIALSVQQTHWPLRTCKLHGFMHRRIYPTMEIWENLGYLSPWYRVSTNAMFVSKGSYGCGEPKNVIALSVQQTHWPLRTCKLHGFMNRRIYPTMEISENSGYLSPWYRVCTKAMFISKGRYGCGEPKNVIVLSVQQTHWPLRTCKLHGFMHRRIYPTMEIWENLGYLSPWYRVSTKAMFVSKGSYGCGEPKNVIALSVQQTHWPLRTCKLHGFMNRRIYPTMEISENSGYLSPWYRVCTKAMFILKGSCGCGEPKNVIALSVQQTHWPLRTCKLHGFMHRRIYPTMEIWEISGYLSPWYRVCTKAMFISKGRYGCGEPKNVIALSVQQTHWPLRTCKLHGFMHRRIYPTMEIWENLGYLSPWYRVCTKAMFISKGSYGCGEPKNVIALSVQQTHWPLRTCKLHGFMHRRIYPTMEIWENLGYLSPWYRVSTKAMFVSKGSYGCGEPKNVIALSVQQTHWPLRTCKLHGFMNRRIYPTMEIWENSGYLSPWYRVCTKAMFISKGRYGCGEPKNVIVLSVQQTHWPLRTCKLHGFMHRRIYPTMEIWENLGYLSPWYRVSTKAMFISKGSYGCGEPKNVIALSVQQTHWPLRTCKLHGFMHRRIYPTMEIWEISGYLSPWYRVCTKAMFISKGRYGCGEPKNVIALSVQQTHWPLRTCKLHGFMHRRIYPTMEIWENSGYLSPWYRVCTKAMFISKGRYGCGEPKNVIVLSVQQTHWPLRTCKLHGFMHRRIYPTMEIWENLGYLSPWYRVSTKAMFVSKGSYGCGEPKNVIALSVQQTHWPLRTCKLHGFMHRRIYPTMEIWENSGYLSPWYRVCTKAMFISKGRYGCGEPKNVIILSVQQTHWPLRTCKLHGFMHRRIYPTMEIWENLGLA